MMIIRPDQLRTFEQIERTRFEDEMIAHSKEFSPRLSAVLGDEQLRLAISSAMAKAGNHGFTNRGPMRLFVELIVRSITTHNTPQSVKRCGALVTRCGEHNRFTSITTFTSTVFRGLKQSTCIAP